MDEFDIPATPSPPETEPSEEPDSTESNNTPEVYDIEDFDIPTTPLPPETESYESESDTQSEHKPEKEDNEVDTQNDYEREQEQEVVADAENILDEIEHEENRERAEQLYHGKASSETRSETNENESDIKREQEQDQEVIADIDNKLDEVEHEQNRERAEQLYRENQNATAEPKEDEDYKSDVDKAKEVVERYEQTQKLPRRERKRLQIQENQANVTDIVDIDKSLSPDEYEKNRERIRDELERDRKLIKKAEVNSKESESVQTIQEAPKDEQESDEELKELMDVIEQSEKEGWVPIEGEIQTTNQKTKKCKELNKDKPPAQSSPQESHEGEPQNSDQKQVTVQVDVQETHKDEIQEDKREKVQEQSESAEKTNGDKLEALAKQFEQKTGKRAIYAKKETKAFKEWLNTQKKESDKAKEIEAETEKKEEILEDWYKTLRSWIGEFNEKEIGKEHKQKLSALLEKYYNLRSKYKKLEEMVHKYARNEANKNELKELEDIIKDFEKIGKSEKEIFKKLLEFKNYYQENAKWNASLLKFQQKNILFQLSHTLKLLEEEEFKKEHWKELLKENLDNSKLFKSDEIEILKKILEKEAFSEEEIKQLINIFSKLSTEELISIFGYSYKRHTENYIQWGWDYSSSTKRWMIYEWIIKNQTNECFLKNEVEQSPQSMSEKNFCNAIRGVFGAIQLINDLTIEIQKYSEELAQIFPERLTKMKTSFGVVKLIKYWDIEWNSNEATEIETRRKVSSLYEKIEVIKRKSDYLSNPKNSKEIHDLEQNIVKILGNDKSKGCKQIFDDYKSKRISGLKFVERLFSELGLITGEIKLNVKQAGLILGGTEGFVKKLLTKVNPNQKKYRNYNLDFKFSLDQLDFMEENLRYYFGEKAKKCIALINAYKKANPELREYLNQQHNIKQPHYFKEPDSTESFYWFGFLVHDGYALNSESHHYDIGIELSSKDRDHLLKFAKIIGLNLSKNDIKDFVKKKIYKGELKEYHKSRIRFSCKPMYDELRKLGFIGSKVKRKWVPRIVKELILQSKIEGTEFEIDWTETNSGRKALAWLYGMYDADGHWKSPYYNGALYSSSQSYLQEIKTLFDIKSNVRTERLPGSIGKAFDREVVSIGLYSLYLSSAIFTPMIRCYIDGLSRKNPDKINSNSDNCPGV